MCRVYFALKAKIQCCMEERTYHVEGTTSRPPCEVKGRRARLILGWGTTREALMLFLFSCVISRVSGGVGLLYVIVVVILNLVLVEIAIVVEL